MSGLLASVTYGAIVAGVILLATVLGIWFERKFSAKLQTRIGPTYVGPIGLLQPIADVVKLLQKEDILPKDADSALFNLAPPLAVICSLGAAAVVPVTPTAVPADLDVGVVYLLAIGGLTVVSVFSAGWGSNNKFALIGGMRAIAQSISYEVPLVLAALVPVVLAGSLSVSDIVRWQHTHHWFAVWPLVPGLPAFVIFYMATLAESNRIPFDIPEAESELVAGVTTEYTGMKFALFYVGEYVHTLVAAMIASALFLGGWDGPFGIAPGWHWLLLKSILMFASVYWVRWSLLRFRSDQLMRLCWRVLTPISVLLVLFAAAWVQFGSKG